MGRGYVKEKIRAAKRRRANPRQRTNPRRSETHGVRDEQLKNNDLMRPFHWSSRDQGANWRAPSGNEYRITKERSLGGYVLWIFPVGAATGTEVARDGWHAWKLVDVATAREGTRKNSRARSQSNSERLYHVVVRNDRTGRDVYVTATPELHHHAVTIMSKVTSRKDYPHLRRMLVEATPTTNAYAQAGEGPSRSNPRRKKARRNPAKLIGWNRTQPGGETVGWTDDNQRYSIQRNQVRGVLYFSVEHQGDHIGDRGSLGLAKALAEEDAHRRAR